MEIVLNTNLPPYLEEILIVAASLKQLCDLNWRTIARRIIASDLRHLLRITLVDESHLLPNARRNFCINVDRENFGQGAFHNLGSGVVLCFQGYSVM